MNIRSVVSVLTLVVLVGCSGPEPADEQAPPASGGEPAASGGAAPSAAADGDGWMTLFDGSSLDQWQSVGDANWRVVDNTVRADDGSGVLLSKDSYDDFDLRLEFWVDEPANSGVFLRCSDPAQVNDRTCYEVNIFDTRPDQTYRTGAIVNVAEPRAMINVGGRWNDYQITGDGTHLTVRLNGTLTVDTEDDTYSRGPIALQRGAGVVIFRDVRIRPR
jgi:hypothetical protein